LEHQRTVAPTTHEPVIAIKLWDVGVVVGAIVVLVAGHAMLAGALPWLLGLVVIVIPVYGGYRVWDYHHERALFRDARLERYRVETAQLTWLTPDHQGNYPAPYDARSSRVVTVTPGNILQPTPASIHYSPTYHQDYRLSGSAGKEQLALPEAPAIVGQLELPGPVSMIEVMKHWDLTPEHLFLALGKGNKPLACSVEDFMHVAHDGPTGSGKTMQWKAELVMLLKADVLTFLANPHFAPISKKGEDWRPIARALEQQELPGHLPGLLFNAAEIRDFLHWLASVEIDRRFTLQRAGQFTYAPLYGFVDEWAEQVSEYPECGKYMQTIIRRGRAVDVCISTNSQGFLVDDIGMSGASRENFQTAYHLGGSIDSASALLDMRKAALTRLLEAEQVTLGKGVALLRNNAVSDPAQFVRLPMADNAYVYYMLGQADNWLMPEYRTISEASDQAEMNLPEFETFAAAREAQAGGFIEADIVSRNETASISMQKVALVSPEIKKTIQRMINTTTMSWSEIAEKVGLASEKYTTFKAVVAEMGYDTSVRRGGRANR